MFRPALKRSQGTYCIMRGILSTDYRDTLLRLCERFMHKQTVWHFNNITRSQQAKAALCTAVRFITAVFVCERKCKHARAAATPGARVHGLLCFYSPHFWLRAFFFSVSMRLVKAHKIANSWIAAQECFEFD